MIRMFSLGLALVFTTFAACAQTSTPSSLLQQIDHRGAKAVANSMTDGQWENFLGEVSSGKPEWIAVVPRLAPGTDAGNSESLGIGLAFALPKNPGAVLSAIDPKDGPVLGVTRVCSAPFIEGTIDDIPGYIHRAALALDGVTNPALAQIKARCLRTLQGVGRSLPQH